MVCQPPHIITSHEPSRSRKTKCIEPDGESQLGSRQRDTRERPCRSSSSKCSTISLSLLVSTVKMRSSSRSSFSSSAGSGPSSSVFARVSIRYCCKGAWWSAGYTVICLVAFGVAALFFVDGHRSVVWKVFTGTKETKSGREMVYRWMQWKWMSEIWARLRVVFLENNPSLSCGSGCDELDGTGTRRTPQMGTVRWRNQAQRLAATFLLIKRR